MSNHPQPTPPVLIDGALYRGGTMLLAGPSKAAKALGVRLVGAGRPRKSP